MKKTLYTVAIFSLSCLSAHAYVDSQFMTSEQFLINSGYSKEISKVTNIKKQNSYSPLPEKTDNRTILKKLYNYLDPCSGADVTFPNHDINFDANWRDL